MTGMRVTSSRTCFRISWKEVQKLQMLNRVQHDGNESNVIPNLFQDLMKRSSKVTDAEPSSA